MSKWLSEKALQSGRPGFEPSPQLHTRLTEGTILASLSANLFIYRTELLKVPASWVFVEN